MAASDDASRHDGIDESASLERRAVVLHEGNGDWCDGVHGRASRANAQATRPRGSCAGSRPAKASALERDGIVRRGRRSYRCGSRTARRGRLRRRLSHRGGLSRGEASRLATIDDINVGGHAARGRCRRAGAGRAAGPLQHRRRARGRADEIPADEDTRLLRPGDIYQRTKLEGELLVRARIEKGLRGVDLSSARHLRTRRSPVPQAVQDDRSTHVSDDRLRRRAISDDAYRRLGRRHHSLWRASRTRWDARTCSAGRATRRFASSSIRCVASQACPAARPHSGRARDGCAAVICEWLCKPFGIEPPLFPRRLDFFVKNRAFSTARAQRELGFSRAVDLEEGLRTNVRVVPHCRLELIHRLPGHQIPHRDMVKSPRIRACTIGSCCEYCAYGQRPRGTGRRDVLR